MSIAEVAKSAGLPARTTCYDEDICLILPKRSEKRLSRICRARF